MTNRTLADRIVNATNTGKEAEFYEDEYDQSGAQYEFTPGGMAQYYVDQNFFGPPVTPGAAVADAVDEATAVTQLNALLASLRAVELINT